MTLSLDTYILILSLAAVLLTMIPIKEPIIKCKSSVERYGASEPTMNLRRLRDSRYISELSSCKSYLISSVKGSNTSLALSGLIYVTIFFEIAFLISTMAFYLFLGFGSFKA